MRGLSRRRAFAFDDFDAAVEAARNDVPVMQERILLEADIDEGGFEAVFEIADFAFENAADQAFVGGAFDGEFLELAFFEDGDAGFERLGVDDDFLVDLLDRLDQALDFLDDLGRGGADGFHDALGRGSLTRTRARNWLLPPLRAGVSRCGSRKSRFLVLVG